ncbi:hypothetical protein [Metasolibacillus sp.]|uniref:hypothetical protein n=1 Tax=Metasolibacillus sp. TaxID=2703680 RepID=UPI0025D1924E|nr:hypothetical protein [Metasolibacillus sp.]MCT6925819.1 hypothetical protein [Metasolibacillus sp.]MCT6941927.1 hypothetical protein [Metasolibacillus sp.]
MKKQVTLLLLFVLLLTSCANSLTKLEDRLLDAGIKNIDKVIIIDVPTKEKRIIDDQQVLEEFIYHMGGTRIMPQENEKEENAQYVVEFYDQGNSFNYYVPITSKERGDYTNDNPISVVENFFKKAPVIE